jgi:hypothetical protein
MKFYEDKTYIKMCSKAEEIQAGILDNGDFVAVPHNDSIAIVTVGVYSIGDNNELRYEFDADGMGTSEEPFLYKIFRQDQLQEMVQLEEDQRCELSFTKYGEYHIAVIDGHIIPDRTVFDSSDATAEISLLKTVMRTKYNKTWNQDKEEWV